MVVVRVDETIFSRCCVRIFVVPNVIIMMNAIHRKLNWRMGGYFCSRAQYNSFFAFTIVTHMDITYMYKKTCLLYLFTCKSVFDTH